VEDSIRISVRELVAFSYFQPDILPSVDLSMMQTGAKAHRARQAQSEGEAEKAIQHLFEMEGVSILLHGRMDAYFEADVPLVEEIKLGSAQMDAPLMEHRAQAVCYAAMLSRQRNGNSVDVSICYVNEEGQLICQFDERMGADALEAEIMALLMPFAAFARRELAHRERRDAGLRAMPFPFDAYRPGQRELAVQVYTGIVRKKRLFASLPTGTGKSAAVLFPALKAIGEGKTEKVLYLTARNTARQSPLNALERMRSQGMNARCCVLVSKEKLCPAPARCHPDDCARARGHYIGQKAAVDELLASDVLLWDEGVIRSLADQHHICPFELALALTELADVVMMDLNHVFDPFAQIKRLIQRKSHWTLLVDEAHHTIDRVRDNLSGSADSGEIARIRTAYAKQYGRKTALYHAMSQAIRALRELPCEQDEKVLSEIPQGAAEVMEQLLSCAMAHAGETGAVEIIRLCLSFQYALEHLDDDYAVLLEKHGRERVLTLYCLLPGKEIARITKGMRGAVFFSATLSPLPVMKQLLGGEEEDACFALPSPFPPENLKVIRRRVSTRYDQRTDTACQIAQAIHEMAALQKGSCIVYFPSYAYLELVRAQLDESVLPPIWVQTREMGEKERAAFLAAFDQTHTPRLGLCVLGGLFSEGIDLPGDRLMGVMIVGVGMPVPSARIHAVRACYQAHFGDGFAYACRIPGMQKVLQAAGRVIRSETDRGIVMLMDERYFQPEYRALLPSEWRISDSICKHCEE